jgi:hypothetical protein
MERPMPRLDATHYRCDFGSCATFQIAPNEAHAVLAIREPGQPAPGSTIALTPRTMMQLAGDLLAAAGRLMAADGMDVACVSRGVVYLPVDGIMTPVDPVGGEPKIPTTTEVCVDGEMVEISTARIRTIDGQRDGLVITATNLLADGTPVFSIVAPRSGRTPDA